MRNPTYHRRRTERLRREDARRALEAERARAINQIGESILGALGRHIDSREATAASPLFTMPAAGGAH